MSEYIIYRSQKNELTELELLHRGFRSDIYVSINNRFFKINVYDLTRLNQDFNSEIEYHGYFGIEPNVIIVMEVSILNIKQTLHHLYKQHYFDQIKSVEEDIDTLDLVAV